MNFIRRASMPEWSFGPPEQGGNSMTTAAAHSIASFSTAAEAVPGRSAEPVTMQTIAARHDTYVSARSRPRTR
jgi:hypothetical protein